MILCEVANHRLVFVSLCELYLERNIGSDRNQPVHGDSKGVELIVKNYPCIKLLEEPLQVERLDWTWPVPLHYSRLLLVITPLALLSACAPIAFALALLQHVGSTAGCEKYVCVRASLHICVRSCKLAGTNRTTLRDVHLLNTLADVLT